MCVCVCACVFFEISSLDLDLKLVLSRELHRWGTPVSGGGLAPGCLLLGVRGERQEVRPEGPKVGTRGTSPAPIGRLAKQDGFKQEAWSPWSP